MKILARCYDRVIVRIDERSVAEVKLGGSLDDNDGQLSGMPADLTPVAVQGSLDGLATFPCDSCRNNYGPRGAPRGAESVFQQFALRHGQYPWNRNQPGWYCMGCSMPPR